MLASLVAGCVARAQTARAPQAAPLPTPANAPQLPVPDVIASRFAPGRWMQDLLGDVRSVETTEFRLERKGGRAVEMRINSQTAYFDRKGFETEVVDGEEGKTVWTYDALGRPAEMIISLGGYPFSRNVISYDVEQRKVTVTTYLFDRTKPRMREVSTFDEQWREIRKETETFEDGDLGAEPDKMVVVYRNTYDAKGRTVTSTIGGEDGSTSHKFTTEYDERDRVVKSFSYEYDEKSGQLLSKSVNTYDARGDLSLTMEYDPRGRLVRRETYTREYDRRGNWITQRHVVWSNDQSGTGASTYIKRRKITYY